jgi:predicted nucleic acid-binding protein
VILDAGFLISVDRSERSAHSFVTAASRAGTTLHTTQPVLAQVWRGARQARLAAFLKTIPLHPFDDGQPVGRLLARARTSDVVDAHLVICAIRLGHDILTGDPGELTRLTAPLGPAAPTIHAWP